VGGLRGRGSQPLFQAAVTPSSRFVLRALRKLSAKQPF
jgi:hypothetical protein